MSFTNGQIAVTQFSNFRQISLPKTNVIKLIHNACNHIKTDKFEFGN